MSWDTRADVVTLRARFSCGFFTAMAGNKAGKKEPEFFYVLLCIKLIEKGEIFRVRAVDE